MKHPLFLKTYLFAMLLLVAVIANATNYYVDPSSTASTQSGTLAAPWKTLSQVQSAMGSFAAGDFIYFKKGETFSGSLNITKSGTATAPITFAAYGTAAAAPLFTGTSAQLFTISNRQYIVFDGFKVTDLTLDPNDRNLESIINIAFEIDGSNYITVKNCDISLVGVGINMVGSYNTMDHNTIGNLRMIKNTPGGDDDYGANPVVISGANNNITSNYFKDCWAYSYDYTYDGGAIEMYGATNNNNKIMYNTAVNCDGFMEIGFSGGGATNDNQVAYNKIVNCGELVYISNSGTYSTAVNNLQFYNNVIVHTVNQLTMPTSMIGMSTSSSTANIVNMKNNIFWLTTGIDVARNGEFTGTQLTHTNNVYHLGTGSVLNFTLSSSELSTTATIFSSTSGTDPLAWNFAPATGSPAIDFGVNLGMARDFAGNAVTGTPNAGILETGGTTTSPLAATSTAGTISCNGGTTTVTVSATGGTAPYTGTGSFTNVAAGPHTYTVTDAAGGSTSTTVTVTQPTVLAATLSAGTILIFGGNTTLTVSATGGTSPYTYKLNSGSYQSSNSFTSVLAGIQTVTVKDANGCTTSALTITITQPGAPNPITVTSTAGIIGCNAGTAVVTVSATGGTAPYTGTGTFTVSAGTYNYTVTDVAGATGTTSITVTQPTALNLTVTPGTITVNGGTTTITANCTGGTPTFTYKLNSGSYQTTGTFSNVVAGTYTITVKDKNGCTTTKTITITEPGATNPVAATSTAGTISCNGGTTTVTVSATGGTTPYTGTGTFTVSAGTYTYTVSDAAGGTSTTSVTVAQPTAISVSIAAGTVTGASGTTTATITAAGGTPSYTYKLDAGSYQSSNVFTGVGIGNHTVTVRDGKACTSVKTFTVTQSSSSPLVITAVATTISCYGSSANITISATGGVAPYTGTGTFTVSAGSYTYTVTDAAGASGTTTITVNQPTAIIPTVTAGTITVAGGITTITVSATGGTGSYSYKLNSGSYQSSNTFTGVAAGTYTITVKDANACTATRSITVTQPTSGPFKLNLVSKTNETCKGRKDGTITVICTGGTAPYTYRINFGSYSSNNVFSNLKPGFYVVTGRSATGATATLYIVISASHTNCVTGKSDDETGKIAVPETTTALEGLKINAYPNPTASEWTLQIENGSEEQAQVIVMNMNGQKVYEGRSNTYAKSNFGRSFTPGMYIVKVTQGNATQTLKLVKAK